MFRTFLLVTYYCTYGLFVITYWIQDFMCRDSVIRVRTMSTGWLEFWLERLTPDQEGGHEFNHP
jgi:hypothetical protein